MFRQIKVQEHQQDFLRIYGDHRLKKISFLSLENVTYGTKPAPYLATRCLLQLAHEGRTSTHLPLQLSKIAPTWMTFCQEQTTSLLLKRCSDN
ncbi:hypothetical protein TNCT_481101 [Trichonephila clavata]|uniref:Uncharacterized protein n=1 Tax=Trichonephila clavata TaxID=2740835 RepID=A0A8X6M3L7_TRICU|nr:hypothetical protein TNCT_481101 [Trichonephila clavata]